MVTIINYGMGNLGSVRNMFKRIGAACQITDDLETIHRAEKILLPGVGAFGNAMKLLDEKGLREVLNQKALTEKVPVLGICLGMQLLTRGSEENPDAQGLCWIEADTLRFAFDDPALKVPHMGWNAIAPQKQHPLLPPGESRFYFVHSYFVRCDHASDVLATTRYGHDFCSMIQRDNVFGAQFHPEKSHKFGMNLLENFSKI
ncbi:MAG: imidazole glycerol phosphate synthase subunit HisH [Saprospiraceae bacterium]